MKFYDSYCPDKPTAPHAHHWVARGPVTDSGHIFICKYCLKCNWLPMHLNDAVRFYRLTNKYGLDDGYRRLLLLHPAAGRLVVKLQDLSTLRVTLPDEMYLKVVAAVMVDKEYPYEEEVYDQEG